MNIKAYGAYSCDAPLQEMRSRGATPAKKIYKLRLFTAAFATLIFILCAASGREHFIPACQVMKLLAASALWVKRLQALILAT